jgi:hypothetical protein
MKICPQTSRVLSLAAIAAAAAALSGCYIVPIDQVPRAPATVVVAPPPAAAVTFTARLYPSNDLASPYGVIGAIVTNDLNGRGHFSTTIDGETFTGESTRVAGSQRDGIANGAGSRGGFISCRYTMNSPTLGAGNCRLQNGATFTMHVGG